MPGYIGDFAEDTTAIGDFATLHDSAGGRGDGSDALTASDIIIYKDGPSTKKATTNGITVTDPADSKASRVWVAVDTSNDTGDSGFWTTGSDYFVVLYPSTTTIDGQLVDETLFSFSIENRSMHKTLTLPGQAAPTETPTIFGAVAQIFKMAVFKKDNDGSETNFYDSAGTTVDQKQSTTVSGGVVTKGKIASGP